LHTIYTKWKFYEDRYDKIREQYRYLLDEDELNKAFDNDSLIKKAQSRIFWYAFAIATLWICMLAYILMIALNAQVWVHILVGVVFAAGLIWSYRKYRDVNGACSRRIYSR
jgi:Flp pilus assembly protein TadB